MKVVWAVGGAALAVGVLVALGRARSAADAVARTATPAGLVDALNRGVDELRAVGTEIATAMREQEQRLSDDLLAAPDDVADARSLRAGRRARRAAADTDPWDVDDEF
ncbi:hypothetical protein [Litorihabitans aurantiacus]|uniref:Uncharacterized protein n=1 Tax=Litorihabitans aurantiacus TaxID=1930061 RepID=A0AA37UMP7_9MICO|nr:hypothetical protein [Litorihabitans aurantiacus]GMA31360.1 hypothetical protein GCM10025875_13520 [Litorihabitans aurantiacus]